MNNIIKLYKQKTSLKELAQRFNSTQYLITKYLRSQGVSIRQRGPQNKYKINEAFFEDIDTEEKSYWLGFIAADGCISKSNGREAVRFSLHLAFKDLEHLRAFSVAINSTYPIKIKDGSITIIFVNIKFCSNLMNKGVTPRKSLTLKPPKNILPNLIRHWIRGYFDGDGSIYYHKRKVSQKRVSITSTREVLEFIQKIIGNGRIRQSSKSFSFKLEISRQKEIINLRNFLYLKAYVYLDRKREIFFSA